MGESREQLFQKAQLRADLFRSRDEVRSDWIVVTFTERFNRDLEGRGFATDFLLGEGYDVLAVKNTLDDWYVHLDADGLTILGETLKPYRHRASYGSSMGGFAAIKFAKALDVERSLAISPIQDIRYEWDTRHHCNIPALGDTRHIAPGEMISQDDISPHTTYHMAFDPYCSEDARHAEILFQMAPRNAPFMARWAGHPVGPTMRASGVLKSFVLDAIALNDTSAIQFKTPRTGITLRNRARYLLDRNSPRLALIASKGALECSQEWEEIHILHAQILHRLGYAEEAITHGMKAIEMKPDNPHLVAIVASILIDQSNEQLAKNLLRTGLDRIGPDEILATMLRNLEL
jgi:tetratricopeptide (TPR) repeat protein